MKPTIKQMVQCGSMLVFLGFTLPAHAFHDPSLGRWLNRDPIKEEGGINLYSFVANNSIGFYDPEGLDIFRDIGKGLAGPGKLCTDKSCDKDKCKKDRKNLPEEGWDGKDKNSWKDAPDPGKCANSDGVAMPGQIVKIPNGWTCTIHCDKDGKPGDLKCERRFQFAPDPEKNPPDFPPSPF